MRRCAILLFIIVSSSHLRAQTTPFIDATFERNLNNELSGDLAFENLRWLAQWHRTGGSRDFHESALFIERKAKEYGLEDVKIVRQKSNSPSWSATRGELWVLEPMEMKLGSYAEFAVALATNSRTTNVTAELVDVGEGMSDNDYDGKDVAGKVVLTTSHPAAVMNQAVWKRGALGVVSAYYHTFPRISAMVERPDQVAWASIPYESADGKPGTFGFMVSPRKGKLLSEMVRKETVVVRVNIQSDFAEPRWQEYVEAWIRGTEVSNEHILLTAHLQEEKPSYNDDGSGCVNILEIGRTLKRMIDEGRIHRPRRDLRFWWTTEISSEYRYFMDNPDDRKNILVNINQDMVGAKQSLGSRIQHITRTPHSLPSYLSDVVENIATYVILGNTHFLNTGAAGQPQPYTRAILSHLGTRERFGAMVVPYFNSTDHLVFNEGIIGIPGITLTNMPDDFIHSTDDDAFQIDQTQLKRNAFIAATTAWFLANASERDVPLLASEVYHSAMKRINADALQARNHIVTGNGRTPEIAYREARNLIEQAFRREGRALESVRIFASRSGAGNKFLDRLQERLTSNRPSTIAALDEFYTAASGRPVPNTTLTARERELSRKIPVNIDNVEEYFTRRQKVPQLPGLHPDMRYETFNFVDGRRSYLDIFNAVRAEAMSAGEFYYGRVTLEQVAQLLDSGVEAGCLTLK